MRRKSVVLVALCLVLVQLMVAFGAISASAKTYEDQLRYDIYRTDSAKMVLDGKVSENEPWEKVPWSEQLRYYAVNDNADMTDFTEPEEPGHFKALWSSDAEHSYLYILVELTDPDGEYTSHNGYDDWQADIFQVFVDETGSKTEASDVVSGGDGVCRRTGSRPLKSAEGTQKIGSWFEYFISREGTSVTVEARYTFYDRQYAKADGVFGFEVIAQRGNGKSWVRQYAWSNNPQSKPDLAGRATLKNANAADLGSAVDENANAVFYNNGIAVAGLNKDASGKVTLPSAVSDTKVCAWKNRADSKLYAAGSEFTVTVGETARFDAVNPKTQLRTGASVRLPGTVAMKFEGSVADFEKYGDDLSKVGIVIAETALVTDELIANGVTPAALTAANIAFVKSETDKAETFEAVLEDITNCEKSYSAFPYIVVQTADGTTVEYAGDYSAENNSRSVIAVAEAAYADRVQIRSQTHSFKIGQEYGIRGFERISYAPYTREQLAFLKKLLTAEKTEA